jgi:hypothetical protein
MPLGVSQRVKSGKIARKEVVVKLD